MARRPVGPVAAHVTELRGLLGPEAILIPCGLGSKKPLIKWKTCSPRVMEDPAYLSRLGKVNIGVIQGSRSGNLCSLDIDSDTEIKRFVEANRTITQTLCSAGARGCNFWWRLVGPYPGLTTLQLLSAPWGEWRADGGQTLIWGKHPSGCSYRLLQRRAPLSINFWDITWPPGMEPNFGMMKTMDATQSTQCTQNTQTTQCTQATQDTQETQDHSCGVCSQGFRIEDLDEILKLAQPHKGGANHKALFTLARGVRAIEKSHSARLPEEELRGIFDRWFKEARTFVKKDVSKDEYWWEFMDGYENVEHPLGDGLVELAWQQSLSAPMPPEARRFGDAGIQQVIRFLKEMWRLRNRQPFFVSCRTIQNLMGHAEHGRAARWLRGLVRDKIIGIVEVGSQMSRKATSYRYLKD